MRRSTRGQVFMVMLFWVYVILFAFTVIPATAGTIAVLAFLSANTGALCARYSYL